MSEPSDKPDAWMPLYIGDYLKDTKKLTAEQHGAYLLIIMEYWVNGAPLDDDEELARIAAMELRRWRVQRPKVQRFFIVTDNHWRHKRIDEELERWAEKRRRAIERARAGGLAKAAKSSATSSPQAVLKRCSSASSTEVEGSMSPSTLSGQGFRFSKEELRADAVGLRGEDWVRSWLDPCRWQDVPQAVVIAPRALTADRIRSELRSLQAKYGFAVVIEGERRSA